MVISLTVPYRLYLLDGSSKKSYRHSQTLGLFWVQYLSLRHFNTLGRKTTTTTTKMLCLNKWRQWTKSLQVFSHSKGWSPQITFWITDIPRDLRLSRRLHEGSLSVTVFCHHWQLHIFFMRPLYSSPDSLFFLSIMCKQVLFILIDFMMKLSEMVFH